jgi:hypothetical protein
MKQFLSHNTKLDVNMAEQFNSDHAVLLFSLPCKSQPSLVRPTIKQELKTSLIFVADLKKLLCQLPEIYHFYDLM